jgi:hypothetical protein
MQPLPDSDIRTHIARYLAGELDIDALREWIYPVLWEANPWEPAVFALASQVGILLAEYEKGHRTVDELRAGLLPFVTSYNGAASWDGPRTGTNNVIAAGQWSVVGKGLAAAPS